MTTKPEVSSEAHLASIILVDEVANLVGTSAFDEVASHDLVEAFRKVLAMPVAQPAKHQAPCGGREYCARFPFCGCGEEPAFPERDGSKPSEAQGLFRKFDVRRVDGSDQPGGKHVGCRYFIIDMDHDKAAPEALRGYAAACKKTHPELAADLEREFGVAQPVEPVATTEYAWLVENGRQGSELRYRTFEQGMPEWTPDHNKAIRYARREDAEMAHSEDEDAWRITEHGWDTAPLSMQAPIKPDELTDEQIIDAMTRKGFIYVHVLDAVNKHFVGTVKDAHALLAAGLQAPKEQDNDARLRQAVLDAWQSYERFGQVCAFEGNPMIYASTLEELAALAKESK